MSAGKQKDLTTTLTSAEKTDICPKAWHQSQFCLEDKIKSSTKLK